MKTLWTGAGVKRVWLVALLVAWVGAGCGDCSGDASHGGKNPGADAWLGGDDTAPGTVGDVLEPGDGSGAGDGGGAADAVAEQDASADAGADGSATPDVDEPPQCAPENQCAELCCESDQLCLREQCVRPGSACAHNLECSTSEICEPSIGQCIPDPGVVCIYQPETDIFDPDVTLAWNEPPAGEQVEGHEAKTFNQVMMTPSVIDLNEDGIPEVIFATFAGGDYNGPGVLRAFDGKTHQPVFDFTTADKLVSAASSLTVGDIDGDGRVEIVAAAWDAQAGVRRGIIAFDDYTTGWRVLWHNRDNLTIGSGGVGMADLDGDGRVEIYGGNWVLDARTGELLCRGDGISGSDVIATAADLDGDGKLEVITTGGAFKFEPDENKKCPKLWTFQGGGGEPAVGDFGTFTDGRRDFGVLDGIPEVVTVNTAANNQVRMFNGQTGALIWSATVPTTGHPLYSDAQCSAKTGAGAPTIADFDGDGVPEIGTAGACYYVVYEADGTMKWKSATRDFSSRVTGSSVFDFQGDGKAEVVYADECFVRVYDGTGDGQGGTEILFERPHTSGTLKELPVIVDVDNNFHADIVAISNDYSASLSRACANDWPAFGDVSNAEHGILILKDSQDRWVSTRPVWNQHDYHVTNVCDGLPGSSCPGRANKVGAIPIGALANWRQPGLNNFRQNVQGEGLFNAPDLTITNVTTDCGMGEGVTFQVTVANLGTRGVVEGTNVALYVTWDGTEHFLTTLTTTERLLPGGAQTLTYFWADAPDSSGQLFEVRAVADADEPGRGQHFECNEDNNELRVQAICGCVDLAITGLAFDCGVGDDESTIEVTISNLGTRGVLPGTHVAVYATYEGHERFVTTLTTTERLLPGGSQSFRYVWADAPNLAGQAVTVRAVADADEHGQSQHLECDDSNNQMTTQADCRCTDDSQCAAGEICVNTGKCIPRSG